MRLRIDTQLAESRMQEADLAGARGN
jgi:hypothetical protein